MHSDGVQSFFASPGLSALNQPPAHSRAAMFGIDHQAGNLGPGIDFE
jgi:hypothetical protein